jgi:hypothetical protein
MRLTSMDGAEVTLAPVKYQFAAADEPGDWDANWLVIEGRVHLSDGRRWTFSDPCLMTWEARELGSWLEAVLQGRVQHLVALGRGVYPKFGEDETDPMLVFTEPNIAFGVADIGDDVVTLQVWLSLEAAPPWMVDDQSIELFDYFVEVALTAVTLAEALRQWRVELMAFPVR